MRLCLDLAMGGINSFHMMYHSSAADSKQQIAHTSQSALAFFTALSSCLEVVPIGMGLLPPVWIRDSGHLSLVAANRDLIPASTGWAALENPPGRLRYRCATSGCFKGPQNPKIGSHRAVFG